MKLQNKKTGEIGIPRVVYQEFYIDTENGYTYCYKSLQRMYAEWKDYEEEPKEYWYIDCYGTVLRTLDNDNEWDARRKEIGNRFKTEEEAEKAVEKLKIYNKLKQNGFVFSGWYYSTEGQLVILADNHEFSETEPDDLTELFGDKIC